MKDLTIVSQKQVEKIMKQIGKLAGQLGQLSDAVAAIGGEAPAKKERKPRAPKAEKTFAPVVDTDEAPAPKKRGRPPKMKGNGVSPMSPPTFNEADLDA